jgi:4-diphosphocytidyl-2-C-methyl-D-erythritol kinase
LQSTLLSLPAPAKLNLFLHITGRRDDGYHELQSVVQFVELADTLIFELCEDGLHFESEYQEVDAEDNLVMKAARLLQRHTQCEQGAKIELIKNIPVGAGMGGGSSDAATTLLGLNKLWGLSIDVQMLAQLGQSLGADIPLFVRGFAAWMEGVGEKLTPIELPELWYILAIPDCTVSTHDLYQDSQLTRDCQPIRIQDYHFGDGANVFTAPVCRRYPEVARAIDWLSQFQPARMTGSGSVVFAGFDTEAKAGRIAALAPDELRCVVTKGANTSPLWKALIQ